MSTFGKKALEVWNYDGEEKLRFSSSPKNIQLSILKKWYPIGAKGYIKNSMTSIYIDGYSERMSHYAIIIKDTNDFSMDIHPLSIKLPAFERDIILEKLLK
jgi:hypothetical protein